MQLEGKDFEDGVQTNMVNYIKEKVESTFHTAHKDKNPNEMAAVKMKLK